MRKKIVAGNWKMNKTFNEAEDLLFNISDLLKESPVTGVQLLVCPPALYLELAADIAHENGFDCGAQNLSEHESGAYTGEISAAMIASTGAKFVIIGHSERRTYFGEKDDLLAVKVSQALKHGLIPVYCCGEILAEREESRHFDIVKGQISQALFHLSQDDFAKVVVAYEPVWAIGTGRTASPEQAQEMHAFIRNVLAGKFGDAAKLTTILYGGSCNAANARELFANPDVDGGLIGGASLKAEDFVKIAQSF
ncbi:MAG: triose-phosphate isomerase [Bacteroidales bacterium]|nr:triose-phosphate isomerase [Bacteroidales bacterium]MBK9358635.1 triose-phosphate isomerase [Bacteroidales bacterium]